jgi:hypothetical protein
MEMTQLAVGLLKPLLWLGPILVLVAVVKSPWFKGWWGEYQVRNLIRQRLDPAVYREFHNVTLRDEFGETTQIDHVYVSPFGVLVIETKHMGHWLSGSRHQPLWTQQIYRHRTRFQNPLRQNYRHIKALESLLGLPEDTFKSIIVFTGDCTFKTEMPDEVCTLSDLIEFIHSIDTRILSGEQVEAICRDLEHLRLEPSARTHREHVAGLRRRHGASPSAVPPAPMAVRGAGEAFVEAAASRLLDAAEYRIRHGGRRGAPRALQFGLGAAVAKGLVAVAALFLVWWSLTTVIGNAVQSVQPKVVAAPAPSPQPVPVPPARAPATPVVAHAPQQPAYRQPTAAEIAEWQRQSEESMRVLERTTPEVPLALPGSPQVGPSAR